MRLGATRPFRWRARRDNVRAMPASQPSRRRARRHRATVLVASDWAPIRAFDPIVRDAPRRSTGTCFPLLRRADLRIVNCECALTDATTPVWKSGAVFKGAPDHVRGLTAVPFDVACLANNHVLDYGVAGLRETLRVLGRHGVQTVGAGLTESEAYAPLTCLPAEYACTSSTSARART